MSHQTKGLIFFGIAIMASLTLYGIITDFTFAEPYFQNKSVAIQVPEKYYDEVISFADEDTEVGWCIYGSQTNNTFVIEAMSPPHLGGQDIVFIGQAWCQKLDGIYRNDYLGTIHTHPDQPMDLLLYGIPRLSEEDKKSLIDGRVKIEGVANEQTIRFFTNETKDSYFGVKVEVVNE